MKYILYLYDKEGEPLIKVFEGELTKLDFRGEPNSHSVLMFNSNSLYTYTTANSYSITFDPLYFNDSELGTVEYSRNRHIEIAGTVREIPVEIARENIKYAAELLNEENKPVKDKNRFTDLLKDE